MAASFPLEFPNASVSDISLACTSIEQLANDGSDTVVSHGSGFFWRYEDRVFLVSARHVFSGRDPFTDRPMSTLGFIPMRFRFYPALERSAGVWSRSQGYFHFDGDHSQPWFQDPEFERLRTDIAMVPVADCEFPIKCLNDSPSNFSELMSHIGFECSVVGYPLPNVSGLMTPIWRRGTLASEPLLPIDDKPMFLLDAATSPGFSGAPVFRRHVGPAPVDQPDGSTQVLLDRILSTRFIGVYAGRLQHKHFGGEVPFVFYGNRIPFILSSATGAET